MDAILMFDVLLYLNIYYYLLAAICHPVMVIAKYFSPNYVTPEHISTDVAVVATMVVTDLLKILIYRKLREKSKVVAVIVGILFISVTFTCTLYLLFLQQGTTNMEYIISSVTMILYFSELVFGILSFFPCCKKSEYY
ncbi:hypothetical protein AMK59_6851 [Oryctes borbonicus]|uniref:Uncharacterized protein n=1 Tax=Oryctes borbonicus TaxID=1629725 RepID=A0A0T6AYM8_9SCAR|nr:hypothetical protein AMK59_6851 [Oryctes borbonicus]